MASRVLLCNRCTESRAFGELLHASRLSLKERRPDVRQDFVDDGQILCDGAHPYPSVPHQYGLECMLQQLLGDPYLLAGWTAIFLLDVSLF